MQTAALISSLAFVVLVFFLAQTLREVQRTLSAYRALEPKIVALLDNARRVTSNVEEITRQVTIQSARIDHITTNAEEMVDNVKTTVDLYNRSIARPALMATGMMRAMRAATGVLFGKNK